MNYRTYLTDDVLPFWLNHSLDKLEGGILTSLDKLGNVKDTQKNIWFVGRSLWSFSVAYRLIEPKTEYLDACSILFDFFKKCELDGGYLPQKTSRDGKSLLYTGLYHSEAYCAMGCAQYYRICKKDEVKKRCEQYFDIAYNKFNNSETKIVVPDGEVPYTTFGVEMLMLNLAQFVRNAGIRVEQCNIFAKKCIDNLQNKGHVCDVQKRVYEYLPTTLKELPLSKKDYSCPGHVFEAAWFVMCEGVEKNNKEYIDFGIKLLEYAMPQGFEKETSNIPTGINHTGLTTYIWWPQCEAVIAFRLAHNLTGIQRYLDIANQIEEFAFGHYADFENGEWYAETTKDGNVVNSDKGTFMKGPFHIPRMLFALISLEESGSIKNYMS